MTPSITPPPGLHARYLLRLADTCLIHAQRLGDLVQPARRDPVDAGLVLVRLLVGDPDQLGHLLLRQAQHDAPFPHARADVPVNVLRPRAARSLRGVQSSSSWHGVSCSFRLAQVLVAGHRTKCGVQNSSATDRGLIGHCQTQAVGGWSAPSPRQTQENFI